MQKILTALVIFVALASSLAAEPIAYKIVADRSIIGFTYQFGNNTNDGAFQDYDANITIDFRQASNSSVDVKLNTQTAKAGFGFATQALRSKNVLHAEKFPHIMFVSNSVRASGTQAIIEGIVTVRGIAKPLTLTAQLMRDPGTKPSERDDLRIRILGQLNRHDFGASGFRNDVGDILTINIDARINSLR